MLLPGKNGTLNQNKRARERERERKRERKREGERETAKEYFVHKCLAPFLPCQDIVVLLFTFITTSSKRHRT